MQVSSPSGQSRGSRVRLSIQSWELLLLSRLKWDVSQVTAYDFMEQLLVRLAFHPSIEAQLRSRSHLAVQRIAVGKGPTRLRTNLG